jgi:hypothetical protein
MKYIEIQPEITDIILDDIRAGRLKVHIYPDGEQVLRVPVDRVFLNPFDIS